MSKILISPVAKSIPFDILNTSIRSTNLQEVITELRKQTVYDPQYSTTTLNGNNNLDFTSSTLQFATGTATGYSYILPNATTLFNGQSFVIINASSASISIKDFTGIEKFELLADSIATIFLQSNSTSAGIWIGYIVSGFATGILSYNIISSIEFSTTSATYVPITGFTVTPVAGRYSVWYNARASSSSGSAIYYWGIFKDGSVILDSERSARAGSNNANFTASTQTIVSVNGVQPIDVRVYRSGGTIFVYDRSLILIRLGSEVL